MVEHTLKIVKIYSYLPTNPQWLAGAGEGTRAACSTFQESSNTQYGMSTVAVNVWTFPHTPTALCIHPVHTRNSRRIECSLWLPHSHKPFGAQATIHVLYDLCTHTLRHGGLSLWCHKFVFDSSTDRTSQLLISTFFFMLAHLLL